MERYREGRDTGRYGYEPREERRESEQQVERQPEDTRDEYGEPKPPRTRAGKVRLRSLDDLDQRTAAARAARTLVAGLESDLGKEPSTGERELIKRIAIAGAIAEDIETRWLQGARIDIAEYATLINAQRRLCVTIGLERRARDVTPKPDLTTRVIDALRAAP